MDVLHYSFSLSACPKCNLLVCQHTSLANLDFPPTSKDENCSQKRKSINQSIRMPHVRLSSHGMNFYMLTSNNSEDHHSWTTFGTDGLESSETIENRSTDQETFSENIPFAAEHIVSREFQYKPPSSQLVRTQSERYTKTARPKFCVTKSFSFSTIATTPKSMDSLRSSNDSETRHRRTRQYFCTESSFLSSISLLIVYILTNIIDVLLLYVYYYVDRICFVIYLSVIVTCDLILWINNLTEIHKLSTRILLIPFALRFYQLYELVQLVIRSLNIETKVQGKILRSTSISTSSTLEMNLSRTSPPSFSSHHPSHPVVAYTTIRRRIFRSLILFHLIHPSLLALVNIYFWSNDFQLTSKSSLDMQFFIPKWKLIDANEENIEKMLISTHEPFRLLPIARNDLSASSLSTVFFNVSLPWFERIHQYNIHSTLSIFVGMTIFYHLVFNYSILNAILIIRQVSWLTFICFISRLCLIITRIYTFVFLIRLHAWWFTLTFVSVHLTFMITLFVDRSSFLRDGKQIYMKFILSILTQSSIDDISVNALISLENISIFLHRLYLETFSLNSEVTLRFIIFTSILISLQIIGFLFDILYKRILTSRQIDKDLSTNL